MNSEKILILSTKYTSEKDNQKVIIDSLCSAIGLVPGSNRHSDDVYLAIDEAITNAMEHGNRWSRKKFVKIEAFRINDLIEIVIEDEGKGFKPEKVNFTPEKRLPLKKRGRGIFIIKKICTPEWNSSGNCITLRISGI